MITITLKPNERLPISASERFLIIRSAGTQLFLTSQGKSEVLLRSLDNLEIGSINELEIHNRSGAEEQLIYQLSPFRITINSNSTTAYMNGGTIDSIANPLNIANFPSSQNVNVGNLPETQKTAVQNWPSNQLVTINNLPIKQLVEIDNHAQVSPINSYVFTDQSINATSKQILAARASKKRKIYLQFTAATRTQVRVSIATAATANKGVIIHCDANNAGTFELETTQAIHAITTSGAATAAITEVYI